MKDAGHSKKGKNKKFCLNEELKNKWVAPGGTITKIEEEYVKGILKVDYICRIMRLTDVLTNGSNAGFVIREGFKE